MILVTVGTQLPFDRLVRAVDEWAGTRAGIEVLAQVKRGSYVPNHLRTVCNLTSVQFAERFAAASVVVAHAGMGTIISALEVGKPLVLLPRLASLGEHRNDHQVGTARHFARFSCIRVADSEKEVGPLIDELLAVAPGDSDVGVGPGASPALLAGIRNFLDEVVAARR